MLSIMTTPKTKVEDACASPAFASSVAGHLYSLGINLVAFDFDQTIVKAHTYGRWHGTAEELQTYVRPQVASLMKALLDHNHESAKAPIFMSVATFSGQVNLIRKVLSHVSRELSVIPIRGSDANWKTPRPQGWWYPNKVDDYFDDEGKQPHLLSAKEEIESLCQRQYRIEKRTTLLIDDDMNNIRIARENGVRAVWLDPADPAKLFDDLMELK